MKMKNTFVKTSEMMEGFCFVTSVTSFSRPSTGRDDDYDNEYIFIKLSVILIK
jgi:hypothetical protein